MSAKRVPLETRFWAKVQKTDGCWLWTGTSGGPLPYGQIWVSGAMELAHRVSWELANGKIPAGMHVRHLCDNPPCVRPEHLCIGTHRDNMLDRDGKGRQAKGERIASAKLDETDVRLIRAALAVGARQGDLAVLYGCSRSNISVIKTGKWWRHAIG